MKITFSELKEKLQTLSVDEYLEFCDQIDGITNDIEGVKIESFVRGSLPRYPARIINGRVVSSMCSPPLDVEIIALNRKTSEVWGIAFNTFEVKDCTVLEKNIEYDVFIPKDKRNMIRLEFNTILLEFIESSYY